MAKRLQNILVKKYYDQNVFQVWMDDDIVEIVKNIPGVIEVKHPFGSDGVYYFVEFDPRYDREELQSEIEELANSYAKD